MMKKLQSMLAAALCLPLFALPAMADPDLTQYPTATGIVQAAQDLKITAPYSGTLLPFDWEAGDEVAMDETLFAYDTVKIYAPENGTLGAVYAGAGDDCETVLNRYGALAAVEPKNGYVIQAASTGAYDRAENKYIHIGETLYFKSASNNRITGSGRVTAVGDTGYTVEVTQGSPEIKESVTLYRNADHTKESCVGKGACQSAAPVAVMGAGRIIRCHAKEGSTIQKGDLLFEAVAQDAAPQVRSEAVTAPASGVISSLNTAPGQQVYKGQVLFVLADPAKLQVSAQVDEVDLNGLEVGISLPVVFDSQPDTVYQCQVSSIAKVGAQKQNASYYTVTLDLSGGSNLLLGMSATVYLKYQ